MKRSRLPDVKTQKTGVVFTYGWRMKSRCLGADCKLGYAIVRPNLLSAGEHEMLGNWTDGRISCWHSDMLSFFDLSHRLLVIFLLSRVTRDNLLHW